MFGLCAKDAISSIETEVRAVLQNQDPSGLMSEKDFKQACVEITKLAEEGQIDLDEAIKLYFQCELQKKARLTVLGRFWNLLCSKTGW